MEIYIRLNSQNDEKKKINIEKKFKSICDAKPMKIENLTYAKLRILIEFTAILQKNNHHDKWNWCEEAIWKLSNIRQIVLSLKKNLD